jgi:hypothetical protein
MPDHLEQLWKFAPVVALLVLALWAGHKGFWYWGKGARAMIRHLEEERDQWKEISRVLLKKYADVDLPATITPRSVAGALKNGEPK